MSTRLYSFVGGARGSWAISRQEVLLGEALTVAQRLEVCVGECAPDSGSWVLRGITSNERYVERLEHEELVAKQEGLGRRDSTLAALIPIRKNANWWALTQNERRAVFEEQSRHIKVGLKYLPPIARRLHHCRDLSDSEPFDFLTWFEYAPTYENSFEDLLAELRASVEWHYVEREVDIRLIRDEA